MKVGDQVRVLAIPEWLTHDLPEEDIARLNAQVGEVVQIRELQSHSHLWFSFSDGSEGFALHRRDVEPVRSGSLWRGPLLSFVIVFVAFGGYAFASALAGPWRIDVAFLGLLHVGLPYGLAAGALHLGLLAVSRWQRSGSFGAPNYSLKRPHRSLHRRR
ncbi:hypothetical protein LJR129_002437 [Acidovorax sp. LjRoot129]|uniref:hypothetical protein n=1 Tax=Acidovorax sp. LjRoot129 TaxID=3342260 RepID=UPI003ECCD2CF